MSSGRPGSGGRKKPTLKPKPAQPAQQDDSVDPPPLQENAPNNIGDLGEQVPQGEIVVEIETSQNAESASVVKPKDAAKMTKERRKIKAHSVEIESPSKSTASVKKLDIVHFRNLRTNGLKVVQELPRARPLMRKECEFGSNIELLLHPRIGSPALVARKGTFKSMLYYTPDVLIRLVELELVQGDELPSEIILKTIVCSDIVEQAETLALFKEEIFQAGLQNTIRFYGATIDRAVNAFNVHVALAVCIGGDLWNAQEAVVGGFIFDEDTLKIAALIGVDLFKGLAAFHNKGKAMLDLKPSNANVEVLSIDGDFQAFARVGDLGSCEQENNGYVESVRSTTLAFAPPELKRLYQAGSNPSPETKALMRINGWQADVGMLAQTLVYILLGFPIDELEENNLPMNDIKLHEILRNGLGYPAPLCLFALDLYRVAIAPAGQRGDYDSLMRVPKMLERYLGTDANEIIRIRKVFASRITPRPETLPFDMALLLKRPATEDECERVVKAIRESAEYQNRLSDCVDEAERKAVGQALDAAIPKILRALLVERDILLEVLVVTSANGARMIPRIRLRTTDLRAKATRSDVFKSASGGPVSVTLTALSQLGMAVLVDATSGFKTTASSTIQGSRAVAASRKGSKKKAAAKIKAPAKDR